MRFEHGGTLWKELEYDDAYNVEVERTSYGTFSRTTHDNWDRPVRVVTGLSDGPLRAVGSPTCEQGSIVETAYDRAGHVVRERSFQDFADAAGDIQCRWVETRYTYNAREQVTDVAMTHLASAVTPGAVIYEMITGIPLAGMKRTEHAAVHIAEPAPMPLIRGISRDLRKLTCALLQMQPRDRPESASQARRLLRRREDVLGVKAALAELVAPIYQRRWEVGRRA